MRVASEKKLLEAFPELDKTKARLIRALGHAADEERALRILIEDNELLKETDKYARSLYGNGYDSHMWRVTLALHAIDTLLGTYGVEPLGPVRMQGPPYEYCNMGDPYTTTLIYSKNSDSLFIGCWGDIAEKMRL